VTDDYFWPADVTAHLARLWRDPKISTQEIARRIERTTRAATRKAARMGLGARPSEKNVPHRFRWTPEKDAQFVQMRNAGKNYIEIGAFFGLGRTATRDHGIALGFSSLAPQPVPKPEKPAHVKAREEAGTLPLPPFHPIAAALLEQAMRMRL
jgi:hypothetical protein